MNSLLGRPKFAGTKPQQPELIAELERDGLKEMAVFLEHRLKQINDK